MLAHHFRFMAKYHKHCTIRLINHINSNNISDEEYHSDAFLYFRSIHGTMAHLLGGDQIWYERILGENTSSHHVTSNIFPIYALEPPDIGTAWEARFQDKKQLFKKLEDMCDAWILLLKDKDDEWVTDQIKYNDSSGVPTKLIRASGLSQVFNHGTHHRGQISAAFSKFGKDCPSFDLQTMGESFEEYNI
jgi:uncharacterized damage-inducible protein DinB